MARRETPQKITKLVTFYGTQVDNEENGNVTIAFPSMSKSWKPLVDELKSADFKPSQIGEIMKLVKDLNDLNIIQYHMNLRNNNTGEIEDHDFSSLYDATGEE